jgi:hypothetical protein
VTDHAGVKDAELDAITEAIQGALDSGQFVPGECLPIPRLVREFGANAYQTVRALLQLVASSYLVIVPDRGTSEGLGPTVEIAHVPVRCPNCCGTLSAALELHAKVHTNGTNT